MGRLADEDAESLELFFAVLPAFIEALPPRPSSQPATSRKKEALKNVVSILRFEVQEMQQVLTRARAEYELSDDHLAQASEALEDVLLCLERLIIADLENDSDSESKFPRLVMFRDQVISGYHDSSLNFTTDFPTETLSMISYGQEAVHLRWTIRAAKVFNTTMRNTFDSMLVEMESQMPQVFQQYYEPENDSNNRDKALKEIYDAQKMCETTKSLFKILAEKHAGCPAPHRAHVHLTGFSQPEIDMIMSLCAENELKKSKKWHQVFWTSKAPPDARMEPFQNSICSALKRSRKFKNILRIHVHEDGTWKCSNVSTADRMQRYTEPPELTLEQLLSAKQNTSGGKLRKKDKLDLALSISRSLLYLSGSPLLQGKWSVEEIYITQSMDKERSDGINTKPYIVGELAEQCTSQQPQNSSTNSRFVLDLGILLWQLLFGRKVIIEPEDEESDDEDGPSLSLFNALNREYGNSQELFVEKPCLDIIANCLNLYPLYELDEQAFREKMYWDVVATLENYLESFYKSQVPPPDAERVMKKPPQPQHAFVKSEIELSSFSSLNLRTKTLGRKESLIKDVRLPNIKEHSATLQPNINRSSLLEYSGNIKDSHTWLDKFDLLNKRLKSLEKAERPPVKIAVLDTGCDINEEYFDGPGVGQDERIEGHWIDYVAGSNNMIDEDPNKHGTAMLTLLLRLLPDAEIFVARVAKNTDDLALAEGRITEAIRHAAVEWDVDIISFSFGFTNSVSSIEHAISYAEQLKGGKILFFAAANNQGRNEKEMFPAWCESVISVRGTSHDGSFISRYNPDTWSHNRGQELYGTISERVPCDWVSGKMVKSGCSVATPIVAAIAATIIWFVGCKAASFDEIEDVEGLIRTRRGMLSVFNVMTETQEQHRRYLAPWQLFDGDGSGVAKVHAIGYALSRLPRQRLRLLP